MTIRSTRLSKSRLLVLAGAAIALAPPSATGALAQGLPKLEWTAANGAKVRLYGQVNKGVLSYDDGEEKQSYGLIDNNNSNTRVGVTYTQGFATDWDYEATLEVQYAPFSTTNTSILQQSPPPGAWDFSNANIRKLDNMFANEKYGTLWIGQGNMASQDTAEVDLSGTTVIDKSAVQESAGGQLIRQSDGTLSDIEIKDAFTNYNGLGRNVRIRYDTPTFSNFGLRVSYGRNLLSDDADTREQDLYDIAGVYKNETETLQYAGQLAYSWKGDDTTILDGSGSVLHVPTGLSVTLAAGSQDDGDLTGSYGYLKLGWQRELISWGKTAFAVDYYDGANIETEGSKSESTAISVVQNITNYGTELWLTYRQYSYDDDAADYDDSTALFGGARFKF